MAGMKDIPIQSVAGINNKVPAERIASVPSKDAPQVDLTEAVNVDIDDSGQLRRRRGQLRKVAGATHSLWAKDDLCLYVKDGVMYRLYPDMSSVAVAAGLGIERMSYVDANGRVYHSNGVIHAVLDAGRVRAWGIDLDQIQVAASATTGTLAAGFYQFAMTLLRADGQESGTGMANTLLLPDGAGVTFTWAVPDDPELTEVALYLTQPDGETLLQAAILPADQGTYTYTGGMRSLPLATQWLDAPPVASILSHYRGRIYLAVQDTLYATAALGYEYCDLRDYRAFDGTRINLVAPVESGLFIGTEQAVYFLAGASFADQSLVKKLEARAVRGSFVTAEGEQLTGQRELAGQQLALFATAAGIVLGMPDGSLSVLTERRYQMPAIGDGAATFRTDDLTQYLLSMQI